MNFEMQSQDDIVAALKSNLTTMLNGQSSIEGTFNSDMLSANAIEFEQAFAEMNMMMEAAFADTSWGEYLTMRAAEFGVNRKSAVAASVTLTLTGTVGSTIPNRSIFATEQGLNFTITSAAIIGSGGTVDVTAQCSTTGTTGNVDAGTITVIPYSIPGITAVTNSSGSTDGYDEEADAELLSRYLTQVRNPATSGNANHYQQWALSVSGVGQVKILPLWNGNGTVKVIIVDDNNATASSILISNVAAYIETVRPIGATVTVTSPAPVAINITANITGTADISAVQTAVNSYFKANGFSISYISIAKIGKILLDAGISDYSNLTINGGSGNITLTNNQIPICGTVSLNAT